jgi:hypothetical protein
MKLNFFDAETGMITDAAGFFAADEATQKRPHRPDVRRQGRLVLQ